MTDIVIAGESGELLTTTAAIAEGIERDHASVIRLVREHQDDLEDFGRVGFEIVPLTTAGGTQRREVARLNEPQATLLLTFMRNNEIVRAFKKRLVRTFFEMRDQLHHAPPAPEAVDTTAISRASAFAGALDAAARALGLDDNMRLLSVNQAVAVNRVLRDLGYQRESRDGKGKLVWSLTDRGREAGGRMMDTGKKHRDGTPVQQLKWPESVAEVLAEEAA